MATISSVDITDYSLENDSENGHHLSIKFSITTTATKKNEFVNISFGYKNANGNGDFVYNRSAKHTFDKDSSGAVTWNKWYVINYSYLYCGEPILFKVQVIGSNIKYSGEIRLILPALFSIASSYMIPQRPTQQHQYVYYNGAYKGEAGCCVANALTAAKEIQEMRSGRGVIQNSIGWFFGATGMNDNETNYETALNFLKNTGAMPFSYARTSYVSSFPDPYWYSDRDGYEGGRKLYLNNQNSKRSLPQKISSWTEHMWYWKNVDCDWQAIFNAIQNVSGKSSSVVLMTLITDDAIDNTGSNGIVPDARGGDRGSHTMVVLGWKTINNRKYWICQNSWGSDWGDNGLCYVPFTNAGGEIYNFYEIVDDPSAPTSFGLDPWSWDKSNGSATASQTQTAYKLLTGKVDTRRDHFSCKVWNDLVDKVLAVRAANGRQWTQIDDNSGKRYLSASACKVSSGDILRAEVYNSVRFNIGSMVSTGITDVSAGDELTGYHIVHLTDVLNQFINNM